MKPDDYEAARRDSVKTGIEKYSNEPTLEHAFELHASFLAFFMHTEAEGFRKKALDQLSEDFELLMGFGFQLDQSGAWQKATPLYEQALALKPDDPNVRNALGWRALEEGDLDEAWEYLDFMRQPGAGKVGSLALLEDLGRACLAKGQVQRAEEIVQHIKSETPARIKNHEFRSLYNRTQKALGRTDQPLPTAGFSLGALFRWSGGYFSPALTRTVIISTIVAAILGGMAYLSHHYAKRRILYVVSGFADPVSISIDGSNPIPVTLSQSITLAEGVHTLKVSGPIEETTTFELETPFFSRLWNRPIWIYNVAELAHVEVVEMEYAVNPKPSTSTFLEGTGPHYVKHVDFPFTTPPQTIQLKDKNSRETKTQTAYTVPSPISLVRSLVIAENPSLALQLAEGYLRRNPNDVELLEGYEKLIETPEALKRATSFLKTRLQDRPYHVSWHRTYQHLAARAHGDDAIRAEYDAMLSANNADAAMLYLRGVLSTSRAEALGFYQRASAADQQLGWPFLGIAYDHAFRGDWQKASAVMETAARLLSNQPRMESARHFIALGSGKTEPLVPVYQAQIRSTETSQVIRGMWWLMDIRAAAKQTAEIPGVASQAFQTLTGGAAPPGTPNPFQTSVDYLSGKVFSRVEVEGNINASIDYFVIDSLLEQGEVEFVSSLPDFEFRTKEFRYLAAYYLACHVAAKPQLADLVQDRLLRAMDQHSMGSRQLKRLLLRDQAPSLVEIEDLAQTIGEYPIALALLSLKFPELRPTTMPLISKFNISNLPPARSLRNAIYKWSEQK